MGDPGRDGRRRGLSTAPGTGSPARPQERRGQTGGPPREAPQARTWGLRARPAVQVRAPRRARPPANAKSPRPGAEADRAAQCLT